MLLDSRLFYVPIGWGVNCRTAGSVDAAFMRTQSKIYRGYELNGVRKSSMWDVQIWPAEFHLRPLDPKDQHVSHEDLAIAFTRASRLVDRLVGFKSYSRHVIAPAKS